MNGMSRDADHTPATVKSADRVLTLFELLGTGSREMSHTDIAAALDIPKSSLTQLLKNLVGRGWLAYSPGTKGYSLGDAFTRLARRAGRARDLVECAGPVLTELTARTSESSAMNVLKDDKAEVVATVLGPQRLVSHMRLGDVAPLYATSGGKVILAYLSPELQEQYLSRVAFVRATPTTIHSAQALREQLHEIRRQGVAFSFEEWTPGITGAARPVLSRSGEVIASINVAVPSVRFDDKLRKKIAAALLWAVEAVQSELWQDAA
jgi:DNA-binding IclR family transcriptional regulator